MSDLFEWIHLAPDDESSDLNGLLALIGAEKDERTRIEVSSYLLSRPRKESILDILLCELIHLFLLFLATIVEGKVTQKYPGHIEEECILPLAPESVRNKLAVGPKDYLPWALDSNVSNN